MDRMREMEIFVRVVETGSFSMAARDLEIGQPTISKAVAALEDRLGVRSCWFARRGGYRLQKQGLLSMSVLFGLLQKQMKRMQLHKE